MMSGSRLALVAADPDLVTPISNHLRKATGQPVLTVPFNEIRGYLGPDTDGALVLTVFDPPQVEEALRLVRELSLRKWPPCLFLLIGGESAGGGPGPGGPGGRGGGQLEWAGGGGPP